ncbi:TIGR00268 family protein [Pseudonocardia benzenivorans]
MSDATPQDGPAARLEALRTRLRAEPRLLVAYSGGADSALVAAVAAEELDPPRWPSRPCPPACPRANAGPRATSPVATASPTSRSRPTSSTAPSTSRTPATGASTASPRCSTRWSRSRSSPGAAIALGTNLDDLGDHRPGQRAAALRGAVAPLVDAGLTKSDVRAVSALLGLETADKPAAACLSSRVAYGDPVTEQVLARIEAAEEALRALGFASCRVRAHADGTVARLEVPEAEYPRVTTLRAEIDAAVRGAGFAFCAVDLQAFRSGRMNVLLGLPAVAGSS